MYASSNYIQYIQDCKKSGVETDQYETPFPYPSLFAFFAFSHSPSILSQLLIPFLTQSSALPPAFFSFFLITEVE